MVFVALVAGGIYALGAAMRVSLAARFYMLMIFYVAILALLIVLPLAHPLRQSLGGSAGEWLALGGLVALFFAYRQGLLWVRARVRSENRAPAPVSEGTASRLSQAEIRRAARHITLREIGGPGQNALKKAHVLIIGAGGLGNAAAAYLGAAGIGTLGIIDDDLVEGSNLQRQILHQDSRIGQPKVYSLKAMITAQNPFVDVKPYHRRLTDDIAAALFADYDVIVDGCDDPQSRYVIARAAYKTARPVVYGGLTQWEGQISVLDPANGAPCYNCLFPQQAAPGLAPSCAEAGVVGPLPGVIGTMMAVETIKLLTGAGNALRGRMMIYDALEAQCREFKITRDRACAICGSGPDTKETIT